jgi:uncharacterized protein
MILLDSNLLLYATMSSFEQHPRAKIWLDRTLRESARVGLPWATALGYVRLASNPRVFVRPLSVTSAWGAVSTWFDQPSVFVPEAGEQHRRVLGAWMGTIVTNAKAVPDAHLAALAVEHGLVLFSADRDFAKFPGLRWRNPLDDAT